MSGGIGSVGASSSAAPTPPDAATPAASAAREASLSSERFQGDETLGLVARGEKTLELGARGTSVKRVQLALIECGHDLPRYGADGGFGREMQAALSAFQRAAGLTASGKLDRETLRALDAKVRAVDHPAAQPSRPAALDSKRFAEDATFAAIARGERKLERGARGAEVEKLQRTLVGLGFDLPRYGADGGFGAETVTALGRFQQAKGLPQTGKLDKDTLLALDDAARAKVEELKAASTAPEEKPLRYRVVADLARCRVYVLENGTDKPVAAYLTSPGTAEFPTRGTSFTLKSTQVMAPWVPPQSPWAAGLQPVPGGAENPMGIIKMSFGAYAQYFHGIPKHEVKDLGRPASHGCLRMSPTNVLEFHARYAGPGTKVTLSRDQAESERLARAFETAGVADRPVAAGTEYFAPILYGEMGFNERLGSDGRITVGGRG